MCCGPFSRSVSEVITSESEKEGVVSSRDKNTIRAFRLSGMEFLLKPVSPVELQKAIQRVMKMEISDFGLQLQALEEDVE